MARGFFLIAICATPPLRAMIEHYNTLINTLPNTPIKKHFKEVLHIEKEFSYLRKSHPIVRILFCWDGCFGLRHILRYNEHPTITESKSFVSLRQKGINNIAPKLKNEIKKLNKSNSLVNISTLDLQKMLFALEQIKKEDSLSTNSPRNKFLFQFSSLKNRNELFPLSHSDIALFEQQINAILHEGQQRSPIMNYATFEN